MGKGMLALLFTACLSAALLVDLPFLRGRPLLNLIR